MSSKNDFNSGKISFINGAIGNFPKDKTIVDLFLDQVNATPNNKAVVFNSNNLSYKELDQLSNQFSNYLIEKHNVGTNDFVGLMLNRSEWVIVALLGIIKSGAAYVPIDIDAPQKRKDFIKEDSNCKTTVDSTILSDFIAQQDSFSNSINPDKLPQPKDLVYVIYTSGTTGNPKGVAVEHLSVVNLIHSETEIFGVEEDENIALFFNYFFDASVEQIFLSLLNGATLHIVDKKDLLHHNLKDFIVENGITHLGATPSYLETLADFKNNSLKRITSGGEACPVKLAKKLSYVCDFFNLYGPTENTVVSTIHKYSEEDEIDKSLPIGEPIHNTSVLILSDNAEILPVDTVGELCVGGMGLARGYLNLPELNSQKFIKHSNGSEELIYRTGDLAKILPNGALEFIGRKDNQVKIRGYRIELEEIETAINNLSTINGATVITTNFGGETKLVAYLKASKERDTNVVRQQLLESLPEYMVPSIFMWVDEFPMTSNGKIDKGNLPQPINVRPESAVPLKKAETKIEKAIAQVWKELLLMNEIGVEDNFFEMGGTSLLTQRAALLLNEILNVEVPVTKIYQFPTIKQLASFVNRSIDNSEEEAIDINKTKKKSSGDIAVIGMAGRFPGANTINELWEVLRDGKETISFFTPEELDQSIPESLRNDSQYVAARGVVPSAKEFDANFFSINLKLAEAMDPQHRLFLEVCWEALEQCGHLPKHYNGRVGVYAGSGVNTYYINNVLPNQKLVNALGAFQTTTVNDKDYIASRISYHLDLRGPAVSVHSACSTSLLAIAEAVESIRNGHCEVALAGGSSITSPMNSGHLYTEGSMLSANGHCRSFDAEGKGTVFSDGAGVVVLKDLELAKKDGDIIYGVVKGVGLNNDGGNKGSFTAPSVDGEARAIKDALADAQIDPSEISYVETHGTATPLGDPIEIEGLNTAFGKQDKNQYCAIGSIKSNMGHCTAAAGVAGFIKTILAMQHHKIPASLGYENPNPRIDFENSPFYVNNKLSDWKTEGLKKAGISSFGVGGTNVHIVVEEYKNETLTQEQNRPLQLVRWSAKSEHSLYAYQEALGNHLTDNNTLNLEDIAYTLSSTREDFAHRSFTVAEDIEIAKNQLLSLESTAVKTNVLKTVPSQLAFMFPGQGAQYLQMGKVLYENEAVFKQAFNECASILMDELQLDIKSIVYPDENSSDNEDIIKNTKYTQPALFVVEYALAKLYMSWDIKPTILIGHSIGEFVAAHLSGVMSLKDAVCLVAKRGQLVSELPGGSMLSIRASVEVVKPLLPSNLSIAAINSDSLCVASGPDTAAEEFSKILDEKNIANKLLLTSHAFHSSMMDPALEDFKKEVEKVELNAPHLPIISTVTGKSLLASEATDVNYWVNHLREAVDFSGAMDTMLSYEDAVLLEVGPGRALTTLSKQKKAEYKAVAISSLTIPAEGKTAQHTVLEALGQLWLNGIEPNWKSFYNNTNRSRVELPSYVFDRKPCWAEPLEHKPQQVEVSAFTNNIQPNQSLIIETMPSTNQTVSVSRKETILSKISEIIANTSGIEVGNGDFGYSFIELGLDSLVLTQMAITCKNEFGAAITFRQLNDELGSPNLLASFLDETLPKDKFAPQPVVQAPQVVANQSVMPQQNIAQTTSSGLNALDMIAQQLQLLSNQVNQLQGSGTMMPQQPVVSQPTQVQQSQSIPTLLKNPKDELSEEEKKEHSKPFGASPKIDKHTDGMTPKQKVFLDKLIKDYNTKTKASKEYTVKHRPHMSDPRVVSGFKPLTKEMVYPLVVDKSSGNRLWDLDGNEYIDTLNGFGSSLFGHQPDFIKEALHNQIEKGYEVGPQHPMAGEVCEMICDITGNDRAALCNTGSEAVLGAMRIARTVTGRSLIVAFSRSYHGINDEVIVRGSKVKKTFPAASGILPEAVQNMLILDYGTEESLNIIRERAHELAAVLVEPVQSRRPEFQPIEFLKEVREITNKSETTLIFDEIITGFRMHPGGAQALFGVKADVTTYGKVIGGGISIGVIAGKRKFMDALDGGHWEYGDASIPEVGVTYFAGTFVRHPLALASTKASLQYLKEKSPALQDKLSMMTEQLALNLNSEFRKRHLPIEVAYYRSLWRLKFLEDISYSELLFVLMRLKGIHIWDGFPCYMTEAYNEKDIMTLVDCFVESMDELAEVGIFNVDRLDVDNDETNKTSAELNIPPVAGAKLGIDEDGNPAWFAKDNTNEGEFVKINL